MDDSLSFGLSPPSLRSYCSKLRQYKLVKKSRRKLHLFFQHTSSSLCEEVLKLLLHFIRKRPYVGASSVVSLTVGPNKLDVSDKVAHVRVRPTSERDVRLAELIRHCSKVHRLLYDIKVVKYAPLFWLDGTSEGPRVWVLDQLLKDFIALILSEEVRTFLKTFLRIINLFHLSKESDEEVGALLLLVDGGVMKIFLKKT